MRRAVVAGHRLPSAEAAVLRVLLEAEAPLAVAEVRASLAPPARAHTTVSTLLTRLVERGLVTRKRDGRAHLYQAAGTDQELAALALTRALEGVEDQAAAVVALVHRLPPGSRRDIARRLRRRRATA